MVECICTGTCILHRHSSTHVMLQVTSLEEQSQESLAESTAENDARIVDKHCKVHSKKVAIDS